jgi:hypothetical protein
MVERERALGRAWLAQHGEDVIIASYRRRYAEPATDHTELMHQLAAFSVATCLVAHER